MHDSTKTMFTVLSLTLSMLAGGLRAEAASPIYSQTTPAMSRVSFPGEYDGYSTDFAMMHDGTYGIVVNVTYYPNPRTSDSQSVLFVPAAGAIRRVGNTLIWSVNGEEIQVAHTRWWYSVWLPETNVNVNVTATRNNNTGRGFTVYDLSVSLEAL